MTSVETLNKICGIFGLQVGFTPKLDREPVDVRAGGVDFSLAARDYSVIRIGGVAHEW